MVRIVKIDLSLRVIKLEVHVGMEVGMREVGVEVGVAACWSVGGFIVIVVYCIVRPQGNAHLGR